MNELPLFLNGLAAMLIFGVAGWLLSIYRNNVTHADSMWSLFFVFAASTYAWNQDNLNLRAILIFGLVLAWALRLCIYLTWRNWGPHEDHRYAEIRSNNEPHFKFKSLYIIFGLQAVLASIISLPLLKAIPSDASLNLLDLIGVLLAAFGIIWETVADWQLIQFKGQPNNKGKVLNTGVWRYSRHPNYFGECCIWWGFYLFALGSGGWWTIVSPLLMTWLLLKFSGVALLEKDIGERRPEYADYIRTTNAFIPGRPRKS